MDSGTLNQWCSILWPHRPHKWYRACLQAKFESWWPGTTTLCLPNRIETWEPGTAPSCPLHTRIGPRGPSTAPPYLLSVLELGPVGLAQFSPHALCVGTGSWEASTTLSQLPTLGFGPGAQLHHHLVLHTEIGHWVQCAGLGAYYRSGDLTVGEQWHCFPAIKFPDLWGAPRAGFCLWARG